MTIHIVTSGEYSDYGIVAVFSTRELADAAVKAWADAHTWRRGSDGARVEEWTVDKEAGWIAQTIYAARLNVAGEVIGEWTFERVMAPGRWSQVTSGYRDSVVSNSNVSAEHAVALLVEAHQKRRAEQALP